jgi:multisubunit Na+/H+ antiporter MnhC subunit
METPVQNEVTFYQDANVTVTQSRYLTNSKTYAMRNISSVHIFEIIKSRKLPIIMIVIGVLMLLADNVRIAGFVVFAIGVALLFLIKNEFAVRISTNSGEANSIVSKDKIYIQKIVDALNEAIIHRG